MTLQDPRAPLDPEDWPILARRGGLPAARQAELERAIDASATLRVATRVGRDFDAEHRVQAGDDALIQRSTADVLGRLAPRRRSRRSRFALLLAATLVVASAAAATSVYLVTSERSRGTAPPSAAGPAPITARHPAGAHESNPAPTVEDPRERSLPSPPALPPLEGTLEATRRGPVGAAAEPERSAAFLFREASAARRAGNLGAANVFYLELQARFPESSEARVSRVSLGKLLLGAGHAREAERQFRAYLAAGGGDLWEEALVGRAEALARLGQSAEEKRVWRELSRARPASVYATRAERRLEELTAAEQTDAAPR